MPKKQIIKYEAAIVIAILVISFIVLLFRDFGVVLIAILAAIVILVTLYGERGSVNSYAAGVMTGVVALWALALISFYLNAKVVHEFDNGGTWVPDKTLGTGLFVTLKWTPMFIAAFFGYDSNTTYGHNDSEDLLLLGTIISALMIVGGLHLWKLLSSKYTKA